MKLVGGLLAVSACILVLMSLHGASASISLGSVTGARQLGALPGESASFEMLLFNIHENATVMVDIAVEGPVGWSVSANPQSFALDFSQPGKCFTKPDHVCLNTGLGGVMARPVHVIADVPDSATPGEYVVSASSYVGGGGSGVTMMQSRTYHFTVNVQDATETGGRDDDAGATGNPVSAGSGAGSDEGQVSTGLQGPGDGKDSVKHKEEDAVGPVESEPVKESDSLTGMMISEVIGAGLFAVVIIAILAASWRLYKRD
jgi:hypothetical protein